MDRMTPAQKEIYHVIEEFWIKFGYGPSVDDVMYITGAIGRGNTSRKMWHLVDIGLCKGTKNKARSIRPASLRVRNLE
jgi:SOS-response transcriptional repressor LexA